MGLGTWQLQGDTATEIVAYALKFGYRLIDTSGDYHNQTEVGAGSKQSGVKRGDIYLVSKVKEDEDTYQSSESNLQELGVDYTDLMLIHRPPAEGVGLDLWEGLMEAKQEGLTKDIGVSNYSIEQIEELSEQSGEMPVVNQIEWSPFGHSLEMLDYCQGQGIVIMAYSPLTRQDRLNERPIGDLSHRYGKTPAQIVIRWNLQHGVVPIPKASNKMHVRENFDVFDFALSDEDMAVLDALNEQYSVLGSLAYV